MMFKGFFENDSLWVKSIFILFIPLFFGTLFVLLNYGVLSLFHITDEIETLKITQLFSSTGMFICASFTLAYLFSKNIRQFLSFRSPHVVPSILVVLSMWAAIPVINLMGEWNSQISFPEAFKPVEDLLRSYEDKVAGLTGLLLTSDNSSSGLFVNLLIMAIIPALGEELLFRGVVQSCLSKSRNKIAAIWITAFLFSAIHFQFFGFVPRLLLGAYFGYLLVWSKSIWMPVTAHLTNNATIVLFYFWGKRENPDFNPETIGTDGSPFWVVGSIGLLLLLIFVIWKFRDTK